MLFHAIRSLRDETGERREEILGRIIASGFVDFGLRTKFGQDLFDVARENDCYEFVVRQVMQLKASNPDA